MQPSINTCIFLIFALLLASYTSTKKIASTKSSMATKTTQESNELSSDMINNALSQARKGLNAFGSARMYQSWGSYKWTGTSMAGRAGVANAILKGLLKVADFFTSHGQRTSWVYINNNQDKGWVIFEGSHSYQMDFWDGQWTHIPIYESRTFRVTTSSKSTGWGDTNAEAVYKMFCQITQTWVYFEVQVRNYEWLKVHWRDQDAYNPCYDLEVNGMYKTYEKRSTDRFDDHIDTIEHNLGPSLVTGTLGIPNLDGNMFVKVVPHQIGTRFPMVYEHCNYLGQSYALGEESVTGIYNLGSVGWNDRISSLRIPPGMRVTLFENDMYGGRKIELTQDVTCLQGGAWNDVASSLILTVGENDR